MSLTSMLKFIGKRLLNLIPVLLIISMLIFGVINMMPGDPVDAYVGANSKLTVEQKENLREELGFNDPVPVQYAKWLGRTVSGDLGQSMKFKKPVSEVMGPYVWNTFILNAVALVVALIFAIPIGIHMAVKKNKFFDNFFTVFSLTGISMPTFFFGLILIFFVGLPLGLPIGGMRDVNAWTLGYDSIFANIGDVAIHMLLPVIVLAFSSFSSQVKYIRNSMIEVVNQDYIRTARSKGLKEKTVIYRHAFRNALIPLVTLLGIQIPGLFSGASVLETVFAWPGIGKILIDSIRERDRALVLGCLIFTTILMVLGNLLSDVLYAVVDPRVKVD